MKTSDLSNEDREIIRIEEELIKALKGARESRNLSQAQLADICKVQQPLIARLESGKHFPQIDTLLKVLMPLGYTLQIVPVKAESKKPKEKIVEPQTNNKKEEPRRLPIRLL